MAKASIVDEVLAAIPTKSGNLPWWERVNDKQAALLASLLEAWQSGKLGSKKKPAGQAISTTLEKYGITIGPQGVILWLNRMAK
jgi:hypothetical protein